MTWILFWLGLTTFNLVMIFLGSTFSGIALAYSAFFLGVYVTVHILTKETLGEIIEKARTK